jgi:hypothetical protein
MSDSTPHFLRVARALARVHRAAVPLAAITSVVAGVHCGSENGRTQQSGGTTGSGGGVTATTGESGFYVMDGGYEGGPVGTKPMPDCYDGAGVGDMSMAACDGGEDDAPDDGP